MVALLLAICSGCATVIKEKTFYNDATPNGAVITHFYDTSISYMGQSAWDTLRLGMVCITPDQFGDLKVEIEDLCSKTPCSKDVAAVAKRIKKASAAFFSRMEIVRSAFNDQPH